MESKHATIFIVIVAVIGIVYLGGAIEISGKPIFAHIDSTIGVNLFMGIHNGMMSLVSRDNNTQKEDPFTKVHVDFKDVLKQTSE